MLKSHRRFVLHNIANPFSESRCIATPGHVGICPRHNPDAYAAQAAQHKGAS